MEMRDLQFWIAENKELLKNYKSYLEGLKNDLVPSIIGNIKDRELDLVNKGRVQQLENLINQLR